MTPFWHDHCVTHNSPFHLNSFAQLAAQPGLMTIQDLGKAGPAIEAAFNKWG
jgi:hypothetical protein